MMPTRRVRDPIRIEKGTKLEGKSQCN